MSEPGSLPSLAEAPLSVLLLASRSCPEAAEVVASWREQLDSLQRQYELVVAGPEESPDLALLREAPAAQADHCRVVAYAGPESEGEALRTGLASTRHPLILVTTCDKQFHAKDAPTLLALINEVHLVAGYRVFWPAPGWMKALDLVKRVLARILLGYWPPPRECWLGSSGRGRRWLARWIFGLRLQDPECRLRLFRREVLDQFPIQSRGEFAHIEVLAKANHLGCIMAETPVSWVPPKAAPADATFAADARLVFRNPEFVDPTAKAPPEPAPTPAPPTPAPPTPAPPT
jgi:hypothetical protein